MNNLYTIFLIVEFVVDFLHQRYDFAVPVGLPCRIFTVKFNLHTGHGKGTLERFDAALAHGVTRRTYENQHTGLATTYLDNSQVGRCFNDRGIGRNEAQHAIVAGAKSINQIVLNFLRHNFLRQGNLFNRHGQFSFNRTVFFNKSIFPVGHSLLEGFHIFSRQSQYHLTFTGNGVAHVAAFPLGQTGIEFAHGVTHHTRHQFVGIGTSFVDFQAGMSATQILQHYAYGFVGGIG